jgi:hypothetical protein
MNPQMYVVEQHVNIHILFSARYARATDYIHHTVTYAPKGNATSIMINSVLNQRYIYRV